MSERRFRIAFSFSGDKREFVAEIAGILAGHFGKERLLYDKYHQAEFARSDLAFHLPALYHDETDLVVAVLSNDYDKKEWCGLEWNAIYSLIKKCKAGEVMLCRFDRVEGQGLFGLAGFLDLDDKTPAEVATLITERLALNEGYPKDYYTRIGEAVPTPTSMGEIKYFFSYARKDTEFVLKLAQKLRAVGVNLWLDQLDILGGQHWDRAIEKALETCQGMIVVLSPESVASDTVMDGVSYALEGRKLVVPVLLRHCNIPFRLRRVQYIDFTTYDDLRFHQLLRSCQKSA